MALIPLTEAFAPHLNLPFFFISLITGEFIALLLPASLLGFGNGLSSGAMMTLGADLAPRDALSEFLGLWRLIGDGGRMSGPVCVGYVADFLGLSPAASGYCRHRPFRSGYLPLPRSRDSGKTNRRIDE